MTSAENPHNKSAITCFKMLGIILHAASLMALGQTAHAQSQGIDVRPDAKRITDNVLLEAFEDKTHDGAYNFSADGEPRRFYQETTSKDGTTTYKENQGSFPGFWGIRNDMVCFSYETEAFTGGCFRVYQVGNCYYYYSDMIPEYSGELDRDYWTARSVHSGELPSCEPGMS